MDALDRESQEKGLNINKRKTKVMVITKDGQSPKIEMKINNHVIEQVVQFNYLRSLVTYDGRSEEEIRRKIILSKNAYSKVRNLVTNAKFL